MIAFPNCKINLGLHIGQQRSDGFHDIETIFYPVPFRDALEVIDVQGPPGAPTLGESAIQLTNYGLPVSGASSENLCLKAYQLLKKDFPRLPVIAIYLLKNIPMGSGLGGGSADGAFTLRLLNDKFHLQLSSDQLIHYALQLGSDCPFFIINQPCYATGRGENLEPIDLNLSGYELVLVHPGIHLNTGWAFSHLRKEKSPHPAGGKMNFKQILRHPVSQWKDILINDFEGPVFKQHPEIRQLKAALYQQGALYAAMSGSGSSLFGLFDKNKGHSLNISSSFRVINL